MNILIIGFGFVGNATYLLNNDDINIYVYDINSELCVPKDINLQQVLSIVELVFICLPTPLNIDGSCFTKLIDDVLLNINHNFIIIRSTIPIGYCDNKEVFFMPEFLTEKNWKNDFINNKHWIFGIYEKCSEDKIIIFKNKITTLINLSFTNKSINYNDIIFCTSKEAELTKLIKNTFLSTKVSYFNEIYDLTTKLNINYNNVIDLVKYDDRIGNSHMMCPSHDGKRGYGGTCLPKDTNSLYQQLVSNNINTYIFESNLFRNEIIDRPDREWLNDINRTTVKDNKYKIILITHCKGVLGFNLANKLLEDSLNKIIYLIDTINESSDNFNIKELNKNTNFQILKFNIKKKIFLPHIDQIYFLISIKEHISNLETIMINYEGLKNILDLCKLHNAKMLYVYSNIKNDYSLINYINDHSLLLIDEYKKTYNINVNYTSININLIEICKNDIINYIIKNLHR